MSKAMPLPDPVAAEILRQHFRLMHMAAVVVVAFAIPSLWLMYGLLPTPFLAAWLSFLLAITAARVWVSTWAARTDMTAANFRTFHALSIVGNALNGVVWGVLGCEAVFLGPSYPVGTLLAFLIFMFGTTFQASSPANYRPAFIAYVACLSTPLILAVWTEYGAAYPALGVFMLVYIAVMIAIGRHMQRAAVEAVARRHENERLLQDLRLQKAEVEKAHTAKTVFLAAASHDLRQPMQAIVLLVENLTERVREPELRRMVASIRSSVATMSTLLNSILDISRFDAGSIKPERRHFRAAEVLDRLVAGHAELAAHRGIELRFVPSNAVLESDPALLYRILANFTSNALRYTERGTVLVGCRRRKAGLAIEVRDTGPGIPPERHEDIFREFLQLGNPHRDREQGLGLGLAIVERTAKLLGHPIGMRSVVGRGSMFSVTVPYGVEEQVQQAAPARLEAEAALENMVVLVVDDERDVRSAMTALLERWGCTVLASASGAEALELLGGARTPDIVLADYRLPGTLDGLEVIRRVRERHPSAAGILITGDIAPEVLRHAEESGYRLLHKPLRPARLRSLMGSIRRAQSASTLRETEVA